MSEEIVQCLGTLHRDHNDFRELLAALEIQAQRLGAGGDDAPDILLMQDIVDFLAHFPRLDHDRCEELAFTMATRNAPGLSTRVSHLQPLHDAVETCADQLACQLEGIAVGAVLAVDEIKRCVGRYTAAFRHYMTLEELVLLPLATRTLADSPQTPGATIPAPAQCPGQGLRPTYRHLGRDLAGRIGCNCRVGTPLPFPLSVCI